MRRTQQESTRQGPAQHPSTRHLSLQLPSTRMARAAIASDRQHGAVVPPLYLASNFTFEALGRPRPYDYTRSGNPTRDHLAEALAEAEGGCGAVVTASGMAAVHLVTQLLGPEDLLVASADCYGGTYRLLSRCAARGSFRLRFADLTRPEEVEAALALGPRLVWAESPSNPLLRITDLQAVARGARAAGALLAVDNTFLSPALQRPLALGADLVVHSTTKFINGHSDVVGGAVICRRPKTFEEIAWWANCLGIAGAPFDSYLTLRGLRTLHARMPVHEANARAAAEVLAAHPAVLRVHYPGLPDHPEHDLAAAQQSGFGAVVSFELAGGLEAVRSFLAGLRTFCLAESLGGFESLVAHPATMTHAAMDPEARRRAGIREGLLRLSLGLEAAEDLVSDLAAGLARAASAAERRAPGGLRVPTCGF